MWCLRRRLTLSDNQTRRCASEAIREDTCKWRIVRRSILFIAVKPFPFKLMLVPTTVLALNSSCLAKHYQTIGCVKAFVKGIEFTPSYSARDVEAVLLHCMLTFRCLRKWIISFNDNAWRSCRYIVSENTCQGRSIVSTIMFKPVSMLPLVSSRI